MEMKGNKIVAIMVVLALVMSTMVVLNTFDIRIVKKAGATMGVDEWQNSTNGNQILNMSTEDLIYNTKVDLKFNGSEITEDCRVYKPTYETIYDSGAGQYEYWVNWSRISGTLGATSEEPTITDVNLTVAGLWLVCADNAPELYRVDLSTMQIQPFEFAAWEDIVGWFWVNSSSWSVDLSKTSVYYDRNDTLTVTVKKGGSPVSSTGWIDIWNVSGSQHTLVYHKELKAADEGVWEISGSLMYTLTHSAGAGTYRVTAYEDKDPGHTTSLDIYGDEGDANYNAEYGFNSTFGNTTIWTKFDGAIRDWQGTPAAGNTDNTTYWWDTCGPFNPPEYWADYENFTVKAGEPTFKITNDTQFWNDTADNEVLINVTDYDGNPLFVFDADTDIILYNKNNRPGRSGSTPISRDHYNVTIRSNSEIVITPNGDFSNKWGWNGTSNYVWAEKGTLYIVVHNGTGVGNETDEWNGTAEISLTSAKASFKWVFDGEAPNTDGELLVIPNANNVPIDIKFKILGPDYEEFGDNGVVAAAENITISGNSLFTGKLDKFPGFGDGTGWYTNQTGTWTVPIIPTMSKNGGEIKITAKAWNKTVVGVLTIGGSEYWTNGSVVTVTPNEFKIDEQNRTLSITVTDGTGYNIRGATVYLYYMDETAYDPGGSPILNGHEVNRITSDVNGEYSMVFNITQQTDNQTEAGLADIKAPRNLTLFVSSAAGNGYALIKMTPINDLEVELSRTIFLAGYSYDYWYLNCTFAGNDTDTPSEDDKDEFFFKIYNDTGEDVTDTIISEGTYTSADLTNDADYSYDLTDVYFTEPGTYTVHCYNSTHDSTGFNATFIVEQVTVGCNISEFIWHHDENISALFSVTYLGAPINGSLVIDNMSDTGDFNKTWTNTSFDGTTDQGGNSSIEIDETDLVNGQIKINDITASYLHPDEAVQNITFWFMPESPHDGAYARAIGTVPVKIADVTPTPGSIPYSEDAELEILLTGRGTPLKDLLVNISIPGISGEMSTRTNANGIALFAFTPPTTGNIKIEVENRTTDIEVPITSWKLYVDSQPEVDEGDSFTVTVRNGTASGAGLSGAMVKFNRVTKTTDANGEADFPAPAVTSDREFTILATKDGYAEDTETIVVVNKPKLVIVPPSGIVTSDSFTVTIADDAGNPIIGATVTFNDKSYTSGSQGATKINAPTDKGNYTIKATKMGFADSDTIEIEYDPGIPGFELLTMIVAIGVALILLRRRRH
jgi:hypothetical protein